MDDLRPEDEVLSTEGDNSEGEQQAQDAQKQLDDMRKKNEEMAANIARMEQEKKMMEMELEMRKNPQAVERPSPTPEISESEILERLDDYSNPERRVEALRLMEERGAKKMLEKLGVKPERITALVDEWDRVKENSGREAEAREYIKKMGRNPDEELAKYKNAIYKKWESDPNKHVLQAYTECLIESGDFGAFNSAAHGVDGVGGSQGSTGEGAIPQLVKDSYYAGNIKEKFGLSLKEYADRAAQTKKRMDERG